MAKILYLEVVNVKRVKSIKIKPENNLIILTGKNAQGKSSGIHAVKAALGGGRIPSGMLRNGTKKGHAIIDIGNLIIEKTFEPKDHCKLKITGKDKTIWPSPQKILDEMFGPLDIDPLAIARKKGKDQVDAILKAIGVDFTKLDADRAAIFSKRTGVNGDLKSTKARLDAMTWHEDAPDQEQSSNDLLSTIERCQEDNGHNNAERRVLDELRTEVTDLKTERDKLDAKIAELTATGKEQAKTVAELFDYDVDEIKEKLSMLEGDNAKVRDNAQYKALEIEAETKSANTDELTADIAIIDVKKAELIAAANLPVDDLEFGDKGLIYKGVSFEQASSAERLKVCTAIALAKSEVVIIEEGSTLDKESRAEINKMAEDADKTILMECPEIDDECAVIIEDGMVVKSKKEVA